MQLVAKMVSPEEQAELDAVKGLRVTSLDLDQRVGVPYAALDHGFVRVVDYMGTEEAIVQAARVSYGRGTKKAQDDTGLIRYLMRHHHSTPFEMCEIKLHVKLPVFVARHWVRHRTASINEYSARYSILDREFYIPEPEVVAKQSSVNNQGRGATLTHEDAQAVRALLWEDAHRAYDHYEDMIDPAKCGLARELARMNLPINVYTQWYWKTNLHNLLHFLRLRADRHAQYEIRVYAEIIAELVKVWVPQVYQAFLDYQMEAQTFSRQEVHMLRAALGFGAHVSLRHDVDLAVQRGALSKREAEEFRQKLGL